VRGPVPGPNVHFNINLFMASYIFLAISLTVLIVMFVLAYKEAQSARGAREAVDGKSEAES
jgi:hypothetical protein